MAVVSDIVRLLDGVLAVRAYYWYVWFKGWAVVI